MFESNMRINIQTAGWLVFLVLLKTTDVSCVKTNPFTLEDHLNQLTAKEGSCIELKCKVSSVVHDGGAYWFWMKDGIYDDSKKDFNATVIYSTNESQRPVSKDFAHRVKYTGSPFSNWQYARSESPQHCNILICNLDRSDSGQYSLRYVGPKEEKWVTQDNVTVTVAENPCLITFENPPPVKESNSIILTCSTLSSCSSNLQMKDVSQLQSTQLQQNETHKSITVNFTVNVKDDGRQFSCQTQENTDKYLIKNITISVEYAPRDTSASRSSDNIKEGDTLTLSCSANGVPESSFSWYKNGSTNKTASEAKWTIASITDSQKGDYYCVATNKHGAGRSDMVNIDVQYAPSVVIKTTTPTSELTHGDRMNLTCVVIRSNPEPHTYKWSKSGTQVYESTEPTYVVDQVQPEDAGSYTCTAINAVGDRRSDPFSVQVKYHPRNTAITISESNEVKVGKSLTFTCYTEAYPAPRRFSWYRYQLKSSQWKSSTTTANVLHLRTVQRADEACYRCNATNDMGTGPDSDPVCIHVLYPPTKPVLSMAEVTTEGQSININCSVESYPSSDLSLTRSVQSNSPRWHLTKRGNKWNHTFNVTSGHTGVYTCNARNSEGSSKSAPRTLVVKYIPKFVKVKAQPDLVLNENTTLTLHCTAQSFPEVNSFTWIKTTDGKEKEITKTEWFTVKSVSSSDSGVYRCSARNEIGTGHSAHVEVKVKYAPKHTNIIAAAEQQKPDGRRSVTLTCSTQCFPPVTKYSWYKKENGRDISVSTEQNYTVYSDQPGAYYCVATNPLDQKSSQLITLFDRGFVKYIIVVLIFILIIILITALLCRHRRKNNTAQQRGTQPCFGFSGWLSGAMRGNLIHETALAEPFRSRDDLLPDQPCRPGGQRGRPRPDSTPAPNISTVYCTVNLPTRGQAAQAQKPTGPQGGNTQDDSVKSAPLHFGDKQKKKQPDAGEDVVYAKVSKPKPGIKNEPQSLVEYENIHGTWTAKSPSPFDDDTDSSEDETHLTYTQVSFTAKPGHQRASRGSSSTDDDDIHYSDIKI